MLVGDTELKQRCVKTLFSTLSFRLSAEHEKSNDVCEVVSGV